MKKKSVDADARKKILARRAAFVAVTLAGVSGAGAVACEGRTYTNPPPHEPKGDIEIAPVDGGTQEALPPPDPTPANSTASRPSPPVEDASAPTIPPMPCLSIALPRDAGASSPTKKPPPSPKPMACLLLMPSDS